MRREKGKKNGVSPAYHVMEKYAKIEEAVLVISTSFISLFRNGALFLINSANRAFFYFFSRKEVTKYEKYEDEGEWEKAATSRIVERL